MKNPTASRGNGFAVSRDLSPQLVMLDALRPLGHHARKHPHKQIQKLAESLRQFGFVVPLVVDPNGRVVAGWGRVLAARSLGLVEAPAITVADLDDARLRLLRLALNRFGEESSWDAEALKQEFSEILEITSEIDLGIGGFEMGEIDVALAFAGEDEEDVLTPADDSKPARTALGDLWHLGEHLVLCGDSLEQDSYVRLLGDDRAQMGSPTRLGTSPSPAMFQVLARSSTRKSTSSAIFADASTAAAVV